jgi:hypothetical protein
MPIFVHPVLCLKYFDPNLSLLCLLHLYSHFPFIVVICHPFHVWNMGNSNVTVFICAFLINLSTLLGSPVMSVNNAVTYLSQSPLLFPVVFFLTCTLIFLYSI